MNINELTVGQIKEIQSFIGKPQDDNSHWTVGANYFLRTVTHHHTGVLVKVTEKELVLEKAAWIADDGRLQNALATGEFNEVEMFPAGLVIVNRASLIDAMIIKSIPSSQK